MPILAINSKPEINSLAAAYRPIAFSVSATSNSGAQAPPVVYCDIYFNNTFYKTIAKSQFISLNGTASSEWEFDIQDAGQEYLKKFIAPINSGIIQQAPNSYVGCFVRFRSSGIDINGFIQPDGTAPIQATSRSPAADGTGTQSPTFYILNATIQNEETSNLEDNLNQFKFSTWDPNLLPLTHRPNPYRLFRGDNDFFPVFSKLAPIINKLRLNYKFIGQATYRQMTINILPVAGGGVFYVPNGPKNLSPIFPGIDFNDVEEYSVQGLRISGGVEFTTTVNRLSNACDDNVRVHFINSYGGVDAINFTRKTIDHDTKSESYQTTSRIGAARTEHSINRFNIKSNDTYIVSTTDFNEGQMTWIQELFDSPAAWIELHNVPVEGDIYVPIVILDGKLQKQKTDDRFIYETELSFRFSHEKITLRN